VGADCAIWPDSACDWFSIALRTLPRCRAKSGVPPPCGCAGETIKGKGKQPWPELLDPDVALSVETGRAAIDALTAQIERLEELLLKRVGLSPQFQVLKTVTGIGPILALTIALEVGDIKRFPGVGEFASYCRCVDSRRLSNTKKKGEANRKNGNPYLAWAFMEAAHFAIRNLPAAQRFYERKRRQRMRCSP